MSNQLRQLLEQVSAWSRAMQWAFWSIIFTLAFLVWDATVADIGAQWSAKANEIKMQIQEVNKPIQLTSSDKKNIATFGEVSLPRSKAIGTAEMTDAVHAILESHNVKNDEYTRTKTTRMKSGSLPGIAKSGQQIEQIIGDIRFEATQEDILKVIADLESSSAIDTVSDIRLTRKEGRLIRVDLAVEAWVVASSSRKGRR
ncbi:MAG: hypothetical protein CMJ26_08315 [Phycisphaerae bacterium]|nr:hypothetical protein [Phycisphaerae bacterium]|tara:strand:- start:10785 stop:11384 length:600 start_codon:yes stop_codon:yes gene_type:complete